MQFNTILYSPPKFNTAELTVKKVADLRSNTVGRIKKLFDLAIVYKVHKRLLAVLKTAFLL